MSATDLTITTDLDEGFERKREAPQLEPGIYFDLGEATYHALPYASNSRLGMMKKSPAHFRHAIDHGVEPTPQMKLGTAIHCAVLEPARFDWEYAIGPDLARNTKDWKAWAAEQPDDVILLKGAEGRACMEIAEAVRGDEIAGPILSAKGRNEVSFVWDVPVTVNRGDAPVTIRCKGRVDRVTAVDGYSAVIDLKSTADASRATFAKSCGRYGYHRQAPMYLDGLNFIDESRSARPRNRRYIFIAVEKEPPYAVAVWELDNDSIQAGRAQYKDLLSRVAYCRMVERWPSYSEWEGGIGSLAVPDYLK